jgi:hypothetical protein
MEPLTSSTHSRFDDDCRPAVPSTGVRLALRCREWLRPQSVLLGVDASDGKPISEFLVILVPADGATDDHLQLLAMVAARFSDRAFRALLDASATPSQVTTLFSEWVDDRDAPSAAHRQN